MIKAFKLISLVLIPLCLSCSKEKESVHVDQDEGLSQQSFFVLCEGLWNSNDARLDYVHNGDYSPSYFKQLSGRRLGDVGNAILQYGSKLYVVVNNSNRLEIIDLNNSDVLSGISVSRDGIGLSPRQIIAHKNNVYLTTFANTVEVYDTTSLSFVTSIAVGRDPEGVALSGDDLYVSNSGGLDYPNYGNSVSIINTLTNQVVDSVMVGLNPTYCISDSEGDVYVKCNGNYRDQEPSVYRIRNGESKQVVEGKGYAFIRQFDDQMFFVEQAENGAVVLVHIYDLLAEEFIETDIRINGIETVYGFDIDPETGNWYISDAMSYATEGFVYVYSKATRIGQYSVGLLPRQCVFN